MLIICLYALSLLVVINGDFSLLGNLENSFLLIDDDAKAAVYSTCFMGMSLVTCVNDIPYNSNNLIYYQYLNDIVGIAYCLQCCGNNQGLDVWELTCPMDGVASGTVNIYGREFRFARNRFPGCPIKRS